MPNRVAHFEIHASDPEKVIQFYTDVFGREITKWDHPSMEYRMVMTGPQDEAGGINGGLVRRKGPKPEPQQPANAYVCTLMVSNVDEFVNKVEKAGGRLVVPKSAIFGYGRLVYCVDPDNNIFGMIHEDKEAK